MNPLTFSSEWLVAHGIEAIKSLPVPGLPLLIVRIRVGGLPALFGVRLFKPEGYDEAEAAARPALVLAQAMKQVAIGVQQRTAELVGTFI